MSFGSSVSGQDKFLSSVSNEELQAELDEKVDKSGDTMTGDLSVPGLTIADYTMPLIDGTSSQTLLTNGAGTLYFGDTTTTDESILFVSAVRNLTYPADSSDNLIWSSGAGSNTVAAGTFLDGETIKIVKA